MSARDLQAPALGGLVFTIVFAFATLLMTSPDGRYGAPFPIGYGTSFIALGGGSFDVLPFVADVVANALLLCPAWILRRGLGVTIATYIAGGITVAAVVASSLSGYHFERVGLWLGSLLVGGAVVAVGRTVRRAGSRR